MKKRSSTTGKVRTDRLALSLTGSVTLPRISPRARREEMDRPGDGPGTTIVPGPQFDALLALLDNPPEVSKELRREVSNRRWK